MPAAGNPQSYTFNNDDLALKRPFIISIHYQAGTYWILAHVLPFLHVALIVTCSKKPGYQRSAAPARELWIARAIPVIPTEVEAATQPTQSARPGFQSLAILCNNQRCLGFARHDRTAAHHLTADRQTQLFRSANGVTDERVMGDLQ